MMSEPIRLSALSRQFVRGDALVQALQGIELTVNAGEFLALIGPSGSGKSTLLNLLGGLDRPTSGELWLNGTSLHTAREKERTAHRRHQVGFIFQSFNLLPRLTAVENVALPLMLAGVPRSVRQETAGALLSRVGLGARLDHFPAELSGGEQQRVAIARALIHKPALILADEPTGNLDSATGEAIMDLLRELNEEEGITLIVVTHDEEVASFADRIVKLRDGQIVEIVRKTPGASGSRAPAAAAPGRETGRLSLTDIFLTALRNLGRRRIRNVLTAAGVLIGIVTLVSMVSFGVGVQREVQRNFESVGLENIFVGPDFGPPDTFDPFADPAPEMPITPELAEEIAALPDVVQVSRGLGLPAGMELEMTFAGERQPVFVSGDGGTPFNFGPPTQSQILAGEFPSDSGNGVLFVTGMADELLAAGKHMPT